MPNNYGPRIKAVRKKAGLTQKELGERMGGLSSAAVGQWENNLRTPTVYTLNRIAEAVGCDIQDLLPSEAKYERTEAARNNPYWERITSIAEKQRAKGMSKYGQGLEANPADILARINHLQEELIDGLMYCEWIKEWVQENLKNAESAGGQE